MDIRLEKRIAPRRNTMIVALIVFNGGKTRMVCVIRNVSDSGAKLEVESVRNVPASFELHVPGHRPQMCRVAWRSLKEMGVEYIR